MNEKNERTTTHPTAAPMKVMLEAEPKNLEIDLRKTCILVVDMQNAFLSKGGLIDLKGFDFTHRRSVIEPIWRLCDAARAKGCKIIYLVIVHHPKDSGTGPESVYWHKEGSLTFYRENPQYKDKLLLPDSWGVEIIDELKPEKDDVVIKKPRYSGFFETNIDTILKKYNIKFIITTGVSTNTCVEATIRDAYYHGYFAILVSDATAHSGPAFMQEASIFNVKHSYGWVTGSFNILKAMR
jgi:ureidoacrylate peracid hydrolase